MLQRVAVKQSAAWSCRRQQAALAAHLISLSGLGTHLPVWRCRLTSGRSPTPMPFWTVCALAYAIDQDYKIAAWNV
jgi:hypothetical protein